MKRKKILITGGHLTPALAFLDALPKEAYEPVFIGRMVEMEGDRSLSQEFRLVTNLGIRFIPLMTGRLTRHFSLRTILALVKIPVGFLQALWIVAREQPSAIVSFGGYLAVPIALAGWLARTPIIVHEQTWVPGLANRFIGTLARRICLTFEGTDSHFPKKKTVVTGLPLRKELFGRPLKPSFIPNSTLPIIYITGGTTGAASMNKLIFALVPKLTVDYIVIHQTGQRSIEAAQTVKSALPDDAKHRYIPLAYIDGSDASWILQHAKLIIGRSGANTVIELGALAKVAVLIPLPWSGEGEQYTNAQFLKEAGSAEIFDQNDGKSSELLSCIEGVLISYERYQSHALAVSNTIARDGATRLVALLAHIAR